MGIFYKENHKEGHYTKIDNDIASHPELSCKAKGLLVFLLSQEPDWEFSINSLISILPEGQDAISSMINELIRFGYVTRTPERSKNGRMVKMLYQVYEVPLSRKAGDGL